jgi:poly-gamma-glutamate synthase PgsB/CapB
MSIHPENHFAEAQRILRPEIVAVTNCWPDHIDALGKSEEEIAATLCLDIPESSIVFVPARSTSPIFESSVDAAGGRLVVIPETANESIEQFHSNSEGALFRENIALVYGIAKHLNIEDDRIAAGLASTYSDIGAFSVRTLRAGAPEKRLILVNAFAANDPTSTLRVLARARDMLPSISEIVGLMCLRADRADRTVQWLETFRSGASPHFSKLYVTGGHAKPLARKVAIARPLEQRSAKGIIDAIADEVDDDTVIFGFGNFVGMGSELVEIWAREGAAYGV